MKETYTSDSVAFNQGSDARLNGIPFDLCPYVGTDSINKRISWQHGWKHVERVWPSKLPVVKYSD